MTVTTTAHLRRTTWPRRLLLVLAGPSLAAWVALWAWGASPQGRYLDHHGLAESGLPTTALLAVFVAGWVLMLAAMMLPTTVQLVDVFRVVVRDRPGRAALTCAVLAGYLLAWTAAGLVAFAADLMLHEATHRITWLGRQPWLVSAGVLAVAGGYQLSAFKDRCLARCRSPRMFVYARWQGRRPPIIEALLIGAGHGRWCAGCCWAVMLVMFALGVGSLAWMLVIATVMAAEKLAPWGARLTAPLGYALLTAASLVTVVQL